MAELWAWMKAQLDQKQVEPNSGLGHNGVNPYGYLMALQHHAPAVGQEPTRWLPWNYQQVLSRLDSG